MTHIDEAREEMRNKGYTEVAITNLFQKLEEDGVLQAIAIGAYKIVVLEGEAQVQDTEMTKKLISIGLITNPYNIEHVMSVFNDIASPETDQDQAEDLIRDGLEELVNDGKLERIWSPKDKDYLYRLTEDESL